MGRVVGLDVGTRTIGVATGSLATGTTRAELTLARQGVKKDVARLVSLCAQAEALVVGLPLLADGTEGRTARLARQVGEALAEATGLPVHYSNERYSTVEADKRLELSGVPPHKRAAVIDQVAACVILEEWMAERGGQHG